MGVHWTHARKSIERSGYVGFVLRFGHVASGYDVEYPPVDTAWYESPYDALQHTRMPLVFFNTTWQDWHNASCQPCIELIGLGTAVWRPKVAQCSRPPEGAKLYSLMWSRTLRNFWVDARIRGGLDICYLVLQPLAMLLQ